MSPKWPSLEIEQPITTNTKLPITTKPRHFELIVFLDRVCGNKSKELQNEHTSMEI